MSLILSWVIFPLLLAVIGAGWGAVIQRISGARLDGALLLPVGLAAALVVAGTLTASASTAPAAVPVVAVGALAGLVFAWPGLRVQRSLLLATVGILFVYGAPVLLSGQATFAGFLRLDDTATWLGITDQVMSHGRALSYLPSSTYRNVLQAYVGDSYPLGAFMLLGVGHGLTGIDAAWIFQPELACCAVAVGLGIYALTRPFIDSPRLRALVAFLGAQPALLYGYSLWGGIKELTAAFLLVLGAALAAPMLAKRPGRPRELLPLAIAAGALIQTLGAGAAGWVVAALVVLFTAWLWRARHATALRAGVISLCWLGVLTALLVVPVWAVLSSFLSADAGLFSSGQSSAELLGNLAHPLSVFQLAGIWPVGDFRSTAPTLQSALLIGLVLVAAAGGLAAGIWRRQFGVVLYVVVALVGCDVVYLTGATPWVTGKTLAIASPALLVAALTAGGMLWSARSRHRLAAGGGVLLILGLLGGVMWSNVLGYHDATLAPRPALSELQHIGGLVAGKGPTFVNDYEVYADRHFLREGDPVEPAEYRSVPLALREGTVLTKSAWSDIDSFPLSTLEPYRSLVLRRSPAESRPPSIYDLVYRGRYYELWQRPEQSSVRIIEHVPLGESNALPYCGATQNTANRPLCSVDPVAVPPCKQIQALGRRASQLHATLLAYQRPAPVVARGNQTQWPVRWSSDPAARTLTPNTPGTARVHIYVDGGQRYELWLDGSFARGFEVTIEGHYLTTVGNELSSTDGYVPVTEFDLGPGIRTIGLRYPHSGIAPGSGDNSLTSLSAIVLQPLQSPVSELIHLAPSQAKRLCGRSLDWIEIVIPSKRSRI